MKYALAIFFLLAPGMAQAYPPKLCVTMSNLARITMEARQAGMTQDRLLYLMQANGDQKVMILARPLARGAWAEPHYIDRVRQVDAVISFQDAITRRCYQGADYATY